MEPKTLLTIEPLWEGQEFSGPPIPSIFFQGPDCHYKLTIAINL